ncbi:hypothetical protein OMAG_002068 [Candidatus Omnitrophus magneticus]|uniref:Uncharacterized protein n=1 Tax=Candidatus Omnitrophus magneticus TaxID=1609969 RepID=A0A0F0CPX2_9BACT|nr:hypothetical protein OMAG_002068 [Candidatus Omnitrophus magneticus]
MRNIYVRDIKILFLLIIYIVNMNHSGFCVDEVKGVNSNSKFLNRLANKQNALMCLGTITLPLNNVFQKEELFTSDNKIEKDLLSPPKTKYAERLESKLIDLVKCSVKDIGCGIYRGAGTFVPNALIPESKAEKKSAVISANKNLK